MVKAIFTLLVLASAGLAQSSSDGPLSVHHSTYANFSLTPAQMRQAESLDSEAGPLASNVVPSLPTISKDVQEVNLTFTVTDHRGHFVRNLTPSDFTIHDNGELPERLTYFESQAELPLRLALVIDTSESMASEFNEEKRAATAFLRKTLRPASDLALIIDFNQQVRLTQGLTSNSKMLSHAIRTLRNGGETAIYDAVSAASQQLAKIQDTLTSRRAIILITDGEENQSHINLQELTDIVLRNDCSVYILIVDVAFRNLDQSFRLMKELAQATGGDVLRARSEEGLESAFSKISKEFRSQYLISYKPASVTPDGSFHRLVVSGPKKLRVHHRDGYFAR